MRRMCAWLVRLGYFRSGLRRKCRMGIAIVTCSLVLSCAVWSLVQTSETSHRETLVERDHDYSYMTKFVRTFRYSMAMRRIQEFFEGPAKKFGPENCAVNVSKVIPCNNDSLLLIAYVYSAPHHTKSRTLIRKTWANIKYHGAEYVKTVFIIGKDNLKQSSLKALELEQQVHGDLYMGDFEDFYYSLTLKGLSALTWLHHCCKGATFALKIDDDVFLNIFTLLDRLRDMKAANDTRRVVWCDVSENAPARREGKYKLTKQEYPDKILPRFCFGPAYLFSTDIIPHWLEAAFETPILKLEDVYFTGILRQKLGIALRKNNEAYSHLDDVFMKFFIGKKAKDHIFFHTSIGDIKYYSSVWHWLVELVRPNGLKY